MHKKLYVLLVFSSLAGHAFSTQFTLQIGAFTQYSDADIIAGKVREHVNPVIIKTEPANNGKTLFNIGRYINEVNFLLYWYSFMLYCLVMPRFCI